MSHSQPPGRVQNYTNAALVMAFVNMIWIFGVILVTLGLGALMIVGLVLHYAIRRLGAHLAAQEAARAWPRPRS